MLKKTYTSLLIMALVLALVGTAAAEPFVTSPENAYRVISPPVYSYKDIWQSDPPYPRDIFWNFDQDPTVPGDAVYTGSDDLELMALDSVTLGPGVEWFPSSDQDSSDSIGIDNSSGTEALDGKAVFHVVDHVGDWPWVKHVWVEITTTIVDRQPQGGARVVSSVLCPENCSLIDAGSQLDETLENPPLNYWFWLGPSPAWEEIEVLIRAEPGEQVYIDSVHIATESVIDPVLCESGMCFYLDGDGDGYGDPNTMETGTTVPSGYIIEGGDCNDDDPGINPGAAEICNDVDDNCDGQVDEGLDSDGDGTADCYDACPDDANKIEPGDCGCGVSDSDSDGDGTADCNDGCPDDADKTDPGDCGCGVADTDADGDGVPNCNDNCPSDPNKTAPGLCGCGVIDADLDGDGVEDCNDVCPNDPNNDADADGICGDVDNCPVAPNADQADTDGDNSGDACDTCPQDPDNDVDGDGVCGDVDNCPAVANSGQEDVDGDGPGDACDVCPLDPDNDVDGDEVCGDEDNCPDISNEDQADTDGDGSGDACDICPQDPNNDTDGDGICGDIDNCPEEANPYQYDVDGIGGGDLCDTCPAVSPDQCYPNGSGADEIGAGEAGTLVTPDESVEIVINEGDLAENTTISVTQPIPEDPQVDVLTDNGRELGKTLAIYILEPKEPGFPIPAKITVRTDVTPLNPVQREQVGLYRLDETENVYVPVAGASCSQIEEPPDTFIKECIAEVDHFAIYAMVELIRAKRSKADVVTTLKSVKTGDRKVDRVINKVVKLIKRSLRNSYWQDELHLKDKHGAKVFNYEGLAVASMRFYTTHWSRRGLTPEQTQAIEVFKAVIPRLVNVDRMLAQTAISETREMSPWKRRAFERYLTRAEKSFQKGLRYVEKDRPWFAIYMFKRSWSYAMMARKFVK